LRPIRFVVGTYNIWGTNRWPEREQALRAFLRDLRPDVLCLQEFRPETQAVLDDELSKHEHVRDPFEGWTREGNIYWSTELFELVQHGAEEIGIIETLRRLFWVRLRVTGTDSTVVIATAHYTWTGNKREVTEHVNPRIGQAERTLQVLDRIVPADEPVIFMGDLNEAENAIKTLLRGGLMDCWRGKNTIPHATHPAYPTVMGPPRVIDWQLYRGPIRPMVCEVVDYTKDALTPSDHKPLLVAYGIEG